MKRLFRGTLGTVGAGEFHACKNIYILMGIEGYPPLLCECIGLGGTVLAEVLVPTTVGCRPYPHRLNTRQSQVQKTRPHGGQDASRKTY
jgi:hypothetical protein